MLVGENAQLSIFSITQYYQIFNIFIKPGKRLRICATPDGQSFPCGNIVFNARSESLKCL